MPMQLEHDYIGLSEVSAMENSDKSSSSSTLSTENSSNTTNALNLKQTELRLGLPGSQSPERRREAEVSLSLSVKGGVGVEDNNNKTWVMKNFVSGAKRGFSDALDGASGKWVFSGNGGSEVDGGGKGGVLFSPRGSNAGNKSLGVLEINNNTSVSAVNALKDVVPSSPKPVPDKKPQLASTNDQSPPSKTQVVGWPPIRSFRKNNMAAANPAKNNDDKEAKSGSGCLYVKVSMDGAPYLRKVDLKTYSNYMELSAALEKMFSCFTIGQCGAHGAPGRDGLSESRLMDLLHGSECVLTYEDKDGDWMLVGDVPWDMFIDSCKRLRIMKGSEAIGLAPRAMEKCKNRN